MKTSRILVHWLLGIAILSVPAVAQAQSSAKPKLYNTLKQKLIDGKQVFSLTQSEFDVEGYCEKAKHYDYTFFDLQHSTVSFGEVQKMIANCPFAGATPLIRVPRADEWLIQHATDLGALGVIVPTVDDEEEAREAARWVRYPPIAKRSMGRTSAQRIWGVNGVDYRSTIDENMLLVVMIETPEGVANAYDIASVPGVDVVLIGNTDLSSFSGHAQTSEEYQRLIKQVHDATLKAGKIFGQANAAYASGHPLSKTTLFYQNGPSNDGWRPPARR